MFVKTLTVSALNNYIKRIIDGDVILNNVSLKGEISNFKIHSSGHIYFSLKDNLSKINCIMFKDKAQNIDLDFKEGMQVEVSGRVKVYDREGVYQMYCDTIKMAGMGDIYMAFLETKKKLEEKGLFKEEHKKALPHFPKRVGVITSPTGAAIKDIINVATRRNKSTDLLIYPALVQGVGAIEEIKKGIEVLNSKPDIDVIIIARGGGSIEDLKAFNDESLAITIYKSKKPIVTGIGHEIDFTIADFVADRRASTPSAAAEITIPSSEALEKEIKNLELSLKNIMDYRIEKDFSKVKLLENEIMKYSPETFIVNQYYLLDTMREKLNHMIKNNLSIKTLEISNIYDKLSHNNPLNILNKGYSIIKNDDNHVLKSKSDLIENTYINIIFKDGEVKGEFSPVKE